MKQTLSFNQRPEAAEAEANPARFQEALTFDQLPSAVTRLTNEVFEIKRLLLQKQVQAPIEQPEMLFTIQEAAAFLSLAVPTIYSKVSKGELPYMKRGKRLYFSHAELLQYLKDGRNQTTAEIEAEAENTLQVRRNGGRK